MCCARILRLLEDDQQLTLTVVDVGTGGAHFLLTLGTLLRERDWLARVRMIGIDRSDRDKKFGSELATELGVSVEFFDWDITAPDFADKLRRLRADVIVVNHVLEHLEGEVQNRYLHDWLLAAGRFLSVSVPINDDPTNSLSAHTTAFDPTGVGQLAASMELRVGFAVKAVGLDETKGGGLMTWERRPDVRDRGGFSGAIFIVAPRPAVINPDPILADFTKAFDPAEFGNVRRAPIIGRIQNREKFTEQGHEPAPIVRQLVVKVPHSRVIVPVELEQCREAIELIVAHNKAANPAYEESYAYLNVFRGFTKSSSYRGLSLNCHGDQLQTLRPGYAFPPDWSYIVSSSLPTTLFEQAFDVSDVVARARLGEHVNIYDTLNKQADRERAYTSENFAILLLSPFVVHSASEAEESVFRVFLKVAFSSKRFWDNRELRRNPAFDIESWYHQDTVGYIGGFFSHAHWNERFLACDLPQA